MVEHEPWRMDFASESVQNKLIISGKTNAPGVVHIKDGNTAVAAAAPAGKELERNRRSQQSYTYQG